MTSIEIPRKMSEKNERMKRIKLRHPQLKNLHPIQSFSEARASVPVALK